MKLRIKSHSVRFRVNAEDMDTLVAHGELIQETRIPQADGRVVVFCHGLRYDPEAPRSDLLATDSNMILVLNGSDFAELKDFEKEGIYIRREYLSDSDRTIRFVAYVEKDKKKKKDKHKHKHKAGQDADDGKPKDSPLTDELEKDSKL